MGIEWTNIQIYTSEIQGSKGIGQLPINWCTSPMMIHTYIIIFILQLVAEMCWHSTQ